ncbi:MAG: F0F1 ATP synthase subunit B, partial [Deltaproteobacteria bacterium]
MHIDWFVFLAQIFNFLLLMYLLKRFLYGRIIKAMDDREAKIAARFAEAEALKVKANEAAELYEKRNQMLNETKEIMLNEATMAADAKRKELMEKVRAEVDAVKARWQDMLAREHDAFFYDLRQRAAKQLYATARKALADLADVELEER